MEEYLSPLIKFLNEHLTEKEKTKIPLYLFATAGLRSIDPKDAEKILQYLREIFTDSKFYFKRDFARIIDGSEEGVFMWLAVNEIFGNFDHGDNFLGTHDQGGGFFFKMQCSFDFFFFFQ